MLKITGGKNSRRYQFSKSDDPAPTAVFSTEVTSREHRMEWIRCHSAAPKKRQNEQKLVPGGQSGNDRVKSIQYPSAPETGGSSYSYYTLKEGTYGHIRNLFPPCATCGNTLSMVC